MKGLAYIFEQVQLSPVMKMVQKAHLEPLALINILLIRVIVNTKKDIAESHNFYKNKESPLAATLKDNMNLPTRIKNESEMSKLPFVSDAMNVTNLINKYWL